MPESLLYLAYEHQNSLELVRPLFPEIYPPTVKCVVSFSGPSYCDKVEGDVKDKVIRVSAYTFLAPF